MFKLSKIFIATSAIALISSSICFAGDDKPKPLPGFPACDSDPSSLNLTKYGVGKNWKKSDDPIYYLSPGQSYCGANYTDQSNVVCLAPGYFQNAIHPVGGHCDSWVQVFNPENGVVSQGRVLDECGAVANSTFGCNDIYLSKQMFEQLAGNQKESALDKGHLDKVEWRFILAPCWSAYAGLPAMFPNATQDPDTGLDSDGFLRCGKKHGADRIVGPDVTKVCNINIKDCQEAAKIAATIPKYKGKSPDHLEKAMAFNKDSQLIHN